MQKYIVRLDDASHTMDSIKWNRVFKILDRYNIKPIVAVIPNNQDEKMIIDKYNNSFWDDVRDWQDKDYMIALHGYIHKYITSSRGIIPMNTQSEFAGVDIEIQRDKIKKGWDIFQKESIYSQIWVAPAHSFDKNTLQVLKEETTIDIISDGISFYPYYENGFFWVPQQSWRFIDRKDGIWTICLHPNSMTESKFQELEDFIRNHSSEFIIDIKVLKKRYKGRKKSIKDRVYFIYFFMKRYYIQYKNRKLKIKEKI
jgi:predicted deacetylase